MSDKFGDEDLDPQSPAAAFQAERSVTVDFGEEDLDPAEDQKQDHRALAFPEGIGTALWQTVTGEGEYDPGIPELGTSGKDVSAFSKEGMTMAGAYATTPDPEAIADIAVKTLGAKRSKDSKGNRLVIYKGEKYYINRPGLSEADMFTLVSQTGGFGPQSIWSQATRSIPRRMVRQAVSAPATSVGLDKAAEGLGSEQGVSISRAGMAGVLGPAFEGLSPYTVMAWRKIFGQPNLFDHATGRLNAEGAKWAKRAGLDPDDLSPEAAQTFADEAIDALNPQHAAELAVGKEHGSRLTRGQAMHAAGDPRAISQLRKEENMRQGAYSDEASEIMLQGDAAQIAAMNAERDRIQEGLGGGRATIDPAQARQDTGRIVGAGVKREEGLGATAVDDAYTAAREKDISLTSGSMQDLFIGMRERLKTYTFDKELSPAAIKSREILQDLQRKHIKFMRGKADWDKRTGLNQSARGPAPDMPLTPQTLKDFEQARRKIGNLYGMAKNDTDAAMVSQIKKELDDWLDAAVDKALFSGDEGALELLKNARLEMTGYARKFRTQQTKRGQMKDEGGKAVEKMLSPGVTPEHIANWIFGQSKLGNSQNSVLVVRRLKQIFGEGSDEWNALREYGWVNMTREIKDPNFSPTKYKGNLNNAMDKGKSLMEELYTAEEIRTMHSFRDEVMHTVIPKEAYQNSRTSYNLSRLFRHATQRLGFITALHGAPVAGTGLNTLSKTPGMLSGRAAKRAVKGMARQKPRAPGVPALGQAGARVLMPNPLQF